MECASGKSSHPVCSTALSSDFFSFLDPVKRSKALGALHLHKTCITIYYASVWLQKRIRLTLKEETEPSRLSTDHQSIAIRLIAWSHYWCPILSLRSSRRLYIAQHNEMRCMLRHCVSSRWSLCIIQHSLCPYVVSLHHSRHIGQAIKVFMEEKAKDYERFMLQASPFLTLLDHCLDHRITTLFFFHCF